MLSEVIPTPQVRPRDAARISANALVRTRSSQSAEREREFTIRAAPGHRRLVRTEGDADAEVPRPSLLPGYPGEQGLGCQLPLRRRHLGLGEVDVGFLVRGFRAQGPGGKSGR